MTLPVDLRGANVVVSGGSMGIGLACARACLEAGASVTVFARTPEPLEEARRDLEGLGRGPVRAAVADASDQSQVDAAFGLAAECGPVTGFIHAAGIYGPIGPAVDTDAAEWWRALEVNLLGSFVSITSAVRRMRDGAAGGGRIAVFAGGGAASPFPRYSAYGTSKAAVVRFVETLAVELDGSGVEINCIAPGMVRTRLHRQTLEAGERAGHDFLEHTRTVVANGGVAPEVGADAAAFLISDEARGITGRFVAAPYDDYRAWPSKLERIEGSDVFTLRRIVPGDRGEAWQ